MTQQIIERIALACHLSKDEAREELSAQIRNLKELSSLDALQYSDLEQACSDLGLDADHIGYFMNTLTA